MNRAMIYDNNITCWMVTLDDRTYHLHCGENFELVIGKDKVPCRLELDHDWYVIMDNARFNLRTNDTYRIII